MEKHSVIAISIGVLIMGFVSWICISSYKEGNEKMKRIRNSPRLKEAAEYMGEFCERTNKDKYPSTFDTELALKIKEVEEKIENYYLHGFSCGISGYDYKESFGAAKKLYK